MQVPEIPKAEYAERIERVRRLMRQHDVDAALIYHDELHMSNGCYLTNYWPTIEAGAVLVPRRARRSCWAVRRLSRTLARYRQCSACAP